MPLIDFDRPDHRYRLMNYRALTKPQRVYAATLVTMINGWPVTLPLLILVWWSLS